MDGVLTVPTQRYNQATKQLDSLKRWLFKATSRNDTKVARQVSNRIRHSVDNFWLSWKRVTTSKGAKTAGVDKRVWKYKNFKDFLDAYRLWKGFKETQKTYAVQPLRRISIPKPEGSKRPLGIPTISDRFIQAIFTPAVEVINECLVHRYKLSTFGFRDSCRAQDAVRSLSTYAHKGTPAIVMDMDITKCFDRINHQFILDSLDKFGLQRIYREGIGYLLTSGYMEEGIFHSTIEGTPQGGVISPARCNLVVRQQLDLPLTN